MKTSKQCLGLLLSSSFVWAMGCSETTTSAHSSTHTAKDAKASIQTEIREPRSGESEMHRSESTVGETNAVRIPITKMMALRAIEAKETTEAEKHVTPESRFANTTGAEPFAFVHLAPSAGAEVTGIARLFKVEGEVLVEVQVWKGQKGEYGMQVRKSEECNTKMPGRSTHSDNTWTVHVQSLAKLGNMRIDEQGEGYKLFSTNEVSADPEDVMGMMGRTVVIEHNADHKSPHQDEMDSPRARGCGVILPYTS